MINVALFGNPNVGKTTVFNLLTGSNQYVGNWPGVTIDKKEGFLGKDIKIVDLPGIYAMDTFSNEEKVSKEFLENGQVDLILNIIDASNIDRNLYLTMQLKQFKKPIILAVNMIDVAEKKGIHIDYEKLGQLLNVVVIPIQASKEIGIEKVKTALSSINKNKIEKYLNGIDPTNEVGTDELKNSKLKFTNDPTLIKDAKFHIIAVPTPINTDCTPNLTPIISASEIVGKYLTPNSIVVYESTVYPGLTEEICIPILEKMSGLTCGKDFKVGYSPERINPGDKVHTLQKTVKIVSGMDSETLDIIAKVYELIIEAGVYKAESIKVAEAAKVIENSQRDINIAFINELSLIFDKLDIDTSFVLKAASTKWNFITFYPGLVGGHCIGVDPYYLTYKAKLAGYNSQVILSGRNINDSMGKYIAEKTIKLLIQAGTQIKNANVAILGITFKENCPDIRNSKIIDIIKELKEFGVNVLISDPLANSEEVLQQYNLTLTDINEISNLDALIIAVSHDFYKLFSLDSLNKFFNPSITPVLIDVKGLFEKDKAKNLNYLYWRL